MLSTKSPKVQKGPIVISPQYPNTLQDNLVVLFTPS